jgi:Flp pilus assembly protein TadD
MSANPGIARMQQGHAARKAGRADEALAHYRSAVELEPGSAEAQSVYGLMLLQLGRAAEAEAPLRKAVALAPSHPAVRMNFAQWLAQQGRLEEAVRVVEGVTADEPGRHWAWERLGELKARLKRFGEAAEHFGRAVQLQPQDPSLLFKLAQANFDNGRRADAAQVLAAAAALAPGNTAVFRLQADLHEAAADWGALEREAVAWRAAAPQDPAPWRALARAQLQSGYPRLAMQSHQRAFELGGRSAEWLAVYGRVCLHALDLDAAEAAFAEADVRVSSTKSMHGHTLGAAGAIEGAATVLGLHNKLLPPNANFNEPDPQCNINVIANEALPAEPEAAISNSFAFGGLNAVVAFKRWDK